MGLATAAIIAYAPNLSVTPLARLGGISYSLYLVHVPIGERLMSLAMRIVPNFTLGFAIALGPTILAVWAFNAAIEEPRPPVLEAPGVRLGPKNLVEMAGR